MTGVDIVYKYTPALGTSTERGSKTAGQNNNHADYGGDGLLAGVDMSTLYTPADPDGTEEIHAAVVRLAATVDRVLAKLSAQIFAAVGEEVEEP